MSALSIQTDFTAVAAEPSGAAAAAVSAAC